MLRRVAGACLAFWSSAALAQPQAPPPPLPVPPVMDAPRGTLVLGYEAPAATVKCAEGAVRAPDAVAPPPLAIQGFGAAGRYGARFAFRIDPSGRVLGVKPLRAGLPETTIGVPGHGMEALQAELSSWRFAPSPNGFSACEVTFAGAAAPLEQAPRPVLYALMAERSLTGPDAIKLRQVAAPGDCYGGRPPRPRVLHFPDPAAVREQPGRSDWTLGTFDLDARGVPTNVRHLGDSGSESLTSQAARAVARSRFEAKPAKGCISLFRSRPAPLPAPPSPAGKDFARPGDNCPGGDILSVREPLRYPQAFNRRRIEGWALLRFDVAPWGEIGGVEVLAAEPAEAFGTAARQQIYGSRVTKPGTGYKGCVVPVRFKLPELIEDGPED